MGNSAICPPVPGRIEATTTRPPILQTHGAAIATPCACTCVFRQRERRGKAFLSATWICPRVLWVITEKQGNSTNCTTLEVSADAELYSSSRVIMSPD